MREDSSPGVDWDGHVLLLHATESERLSSLTAWACRGLDLGEKVIYTEGPDGQHQWLYSVLDVHGIDVAEATRDGRLEILPLADFYPREGQDRIVDRALAEGFPAVRMSAEAAAALAVLSPDEYLALERNMDRLCRTRPVSAMCQYARAGSPGIQMRDAVTVHLTAVRESQFRTYPLRDGVAVSGELDLSNADVFADLVRAATGAANDVLWLDLAMLRFVDAAACRALTELTEDFRDSGGRVLLVAAQPGVARTMRLLGMHELAGVTLVGGRS
ncbi:MAG: MEDS domain-containing protein [Micromonospora sp.]